METVIECIFSRAYILPNVGLFIKKSGGTIVMTDKFIVTVRTDRSHLLFQH